MPKVHVYDLKVQPIVDEAVLNADLLVTMPVSYTHLKHF